MKINIQNVKILCLILLLIAFAFQIIAEEKVAQKESSVTVSPSYKEWKQMTDELETIKKSMAQQRSEIINRLIDMIKEDKYRYSGTSLAMEILGQIRADEATDILLEKADYHSPTIRLRIPTNDPLESTRYYPAVNALVNIRPPCKSILKRIEDANAFDNISCYIAILVRTQGMEISRFVLEKSIEKESDEGKLMRLNYALKNIKEEVPISEKRERPLFQGREPK